MKSKTLLWLFWLVIISILLLASCTTTITGKIAGKSNGAVQLTCGDVLAVDAGTFNAVLVGMTCEFETSNNVWSVVTCWQ